MAKHIKLVWLLLLAMVMACSPKMRTVVNVPKKQPETIPILSSNKFAEANISLLIPFRLNHFNLKTATKAQMEKANLAIDFYQGVKFGFDSAAAFGLNFKLNVFDTRDDNAQLASILKQESFKNSNLVIGPVFPEGIKFVKNFNVVNNLTFVSPLAATKPSEFDNPKLISIINHIDQHGVKIADYIANNYQSSETIVVLINPKKTSEEQFAAPIRDRFKQKYSSFIVQEYSSAYAFETKMMASKIYVVIICTDNTSFVKASVNKLYRLRNLTTGSFDIRLIGHPNWVKQTYNVQQLQGLNTVVSSSYQIDYKSKAVVDFIKKYRDKYHFEPSEYAFKGFDIGFYFGKILAKHGLNYLDYLTREKYHGLHNSFSFNYNSSNGYYNTHLMLLQYKNLSLNKID